MLNYEDMTVEELEKKLAHEKEELEDLEQERMYVMGQTGFHLPGGAVKKYQAEVEEAQKRIKRIEEVLAGKVAGAQ